MLTRNARLLVTHAAALLVLFAFCIWAPAARAEEPLGSRAQGFTLDEKYLDTLQWTAIGPPRGGRATACTGVVGEEMTYYMGATGGGVWKTTNAGITWQPLGDDVFTTGSVGAIAVAESDPNVIYVGMGERCPRGNFSHGDGLYKSWDAGKTWTHIGLRDSQQIGKIIIHPKDADLVYVAALGHIHGPNEERGIYRSADGGKNWEKVLYINENTGAIDMAMNPRNPREIYAAFWEVDRKPWTLDSGGPGSGIHKTTDGGSTWTKLTDGLPKGIMGKIGLAVSPVNPDRIWAMVEAKEGGVYRSDNAGESWRRINEDASLRQRAWYYTHIYADTESENTVYVLNVGFHRSDDGGRTFETRIRVPHGDNHDLWINPRNARNLVNANDGGANVSFDGGQSWTEQDMQPTAQFYHVTVDNQFPYRVYGAQQDNSTISVSSRANEMRMADAYSVGGGESGYIAVHPRNANIVYAGSYGGFLTRYDHATRTSRNVMVWPENPMGWGAEHLDYRFQWTFPIFFSPHDENVIYAAGNVLFKSTDEGQTWQPISPDLTTNDKSRQGPSGGPITHDNTSVEYFCTIFAAAESPIEPGVIWCGSDDGLIHVTRNGGRDWNNVTPPPAVMPEWATISQIDVSVHAPGTVYVAVQRYRMDDYKPYIFKTSDYGRTWKQIASGIIGAGAFVRAVREDPQRQGLLYAGTETGMWLSFDDGENWQPMQMNLPVVPITDLLVKDDDLVLATQGRSFWILRDLSMLRQVTPSIVAAPSHLFAPADTIRGFGDSVDVYYTLADDLEAEVTLEFLEADGDVIKTYKGTKKAAPGTAEGEEAADESGGEAESDEEEEEERPGRRGEREPKLEVESGLNRFSWNMRYPDAVETPGAVMWGGSTRGPEAAPGPRNAYQVRLTVGDRVMTQPLSILADPRIDASQQDWEEQFALMMQIRDKVSETNTAINTLRAVRQQINAVTGRAKEIGGMEAVLDKGKAITATLGEIEDELIQHRSKSNQDPLNYPIKLNNKIAALANVVEDSNGRPTEASYKVFEQLVAELKPQLEKLGVVLEVDVPAFNEMVKDYDMPAVYVEKEEKGEAENDGG